MKILNNRCFAMILLAGFLFQPSLLGSEEDVFTNPTVKKQLIQFILNTTKKNTFWGLVRNVASYAFSILVIPALVRLMQSKKKTVLIETAIKDAIRLYKYSIEELSHLTNRLQSTIQSTQDTEQFKTSVLEETFPFESVLLLYEEDQTFSGYGSGYAFVEQLAKTIHATLYSFSTIKSTIDGYKQFSQEPYKIGKTAGKIGFYDQEFLDAIFHINEVSNEELLVHLLKKVETRKGTPPQKVIILTNSLFLLTTIANFKSLINPTDLANDSRYNNVIFITTTSENEIKQYGKHMKAELDRFDRKIKITKKQELDNEN